MNMYYYAKIKQAFKSFMCKFKASGCAEKFDANLKSEIDMDSHKQRESGCTLRTSSFNYFKNTLFKDWNAWFTPVYLSLSLVE